MAKGLTLLVCRYTHLLPGHSTSSGGVCDHLNAQKFHRHAHANGMLNIDIPASSQNKWIFNINMLLYPGINGLLNIDMSASS